MSADGSETQLERIERLEAHVAHLERQADELSEVLIEHSKTIARLQKTVSQISSATEASEQDRLRQVKEKPPHYSV